MKPILHIVKNPGDAQAIEVIEKQAGDNAYGVAVVFLKDGASLPPAPNLRVYLLKEDHHAGTGTANPDIELISYDDLLKLIFSVESITLW